MCTLLAHWAEQQTAPTPELTDRRCGHLCLAQEKEQKAVMKTFTVNATVVPSEPGPT